MLGPSFDNIEVGGTAPTYGFRCRIIVMPLFPLVRPYRLHVNVVRVSLCVHEVSLLKFELILVDVGPHIISYLRFMLIIRVK